jgi:2-alkyl-3-oxoalkanoate reductase
VRVLIAGSTGVLGHRLVRLLTESGHEAFGLTRNARGDAIVRENGGTAIRTDLFNPNAITSLVERTDVIIHAATAIPKKQRPSASDWELNDRIRVEGIKSLIEVALQTGAKHLIFQSIVWVSRPADQSAFNEDSPVNPDDVTRSAAVAEQMALEAGDKHGFTSTILRGAWLYGPDAWHTRTFGEALRKRMLPIVGDGKAYWSILHTDDAAQAFITALEQQPEGIYHIVDDEPVRVGEFFTWFAGRLGARRPIHVPVWLAKLAAGSYAAEFATTSFITDANRFKDATGWEPQYPNYRAGLNQVVSAWESEAQSGSELP